MREVQSTEAKAHLAQLLSDVERGETIVITRHGRRIARLTPEPEDGGERRRAITELRALGRENGAMSVTDILSAKHEGHRY